MIVVERNQYHSHWVWLPVGLWAILLYNWNARHDVALLVFTDCN